MLNLRSMELQSMQFSVFTVSGDEIDVLFRDVCDQIY